MYLAEEETINRIPARKGPFNLTMNTKRRPKKKQKNRFNISPSLAMPLKLIRNIGKTKTVTPNTLEAITKGGRTFIQIQQEEEKRKEKERYRKQKQTEPLRRGESFKIKLQAERLPERRHTKKTQQRMIKHHQIHIEETKEEEEEENREKRLHRLPSIIKRTIKSNQKKRRGGPVNTKRQNAIHADEFITSERKMQQEKKQMQQNRLKQHFNRLGLQDFESMGGTMQDIETPTNYKTLPMFDRALSARSRQSPIHSARSNRSRSSSISSAQQQAQISLNAASRVTEMAPLIVYNSRTKSFRLSEHAKKFFAELKEPFVVCSFIDGSEEGNHGLMNVLANSEQFRSNGRGIQYAVLYDMEQSADHVRAPPVVLLNVESFTNTLTAYTYECKLFIINLIISSIVCYNSDAMISDKDMLNYAYMEKLFQYIKPDSFAFPKLFWLVRQMMDPEMDQETLKSSFEAELQRISVDTSKIKFSFKKVFEKRACMVVPKITNDYKELTTNSIEYLEGVSILKDEIASHEHVKSIMTKAFDDIKLNGPMFIHFCNMVLKVMNKNQTIEIANAFQDLVRNHGHNMLEAAVHRYETQTETYAKTHFPMDPYDFQRENQKIINHEGAILATNVKYLGRMADELTQEYESIVNATFYKYVRENEEKCKDHATQLANALYEPLHERLDTYRTVERFQRDLDEAKSKFWHAAIGLQKQKVWMELQSSAIDQDLLSLQKRIQPQTRTRYAKPKRKPTITRQLSIASIAGISQPTPPSPGSAASPLPYQQDIGFLPRLA